MRKAAPSLLDDKNYLNDPIEASPVMLLPSVAASRSPMKTLTCRELGGKCDQNLSANSWNEMANAMTRHVMEKHKDVANDIEKMHNEDPQKRGGEMKPKFYAALEHQSAVS